MALLPTAHGPRQPVKVRCSRLRILRRSHSAAQCSLSNTQRPFSPQPQQQLPLAREQTNKLPTTWTIRKSSPRARTLTARMPRRAPGAGWPPRGSQARHAQPTGCASPFFCSSTVTSTACSRGRGTSSGRPRRRAYSPARRSSTSGPGRRSCAAPSARRPPCRRPGPSPSPFSLLDCRDEVFLFLHRRLDRLDVDPGLVVLHAHLLARDVDVHDLDAGKRLERPLDRALAVLARDVRNRENLGGHRECSSLTRRYGSTTSSPTMPACACPGSVHTTSNVPTSVGVKTTLAPWPGGACTCSAPARPCTLQSCATLPAFSTLTCTGWPTLTTTRAGENEKSLSTTGTRCAAPPTAISSCAGADAIACSGVGGISHSAAAPIASATSAMPTR